MDCPARGQIGAGNIGIHSQKRQRYACSVCNNTNTVSPIAGPFMPYTDPAGTDVSGIRITYFDSTGTATTDKAQVARISVVLRGQTRSALNVSGLKQGVYMDSIRMTIALRNRS